MIFSDLINLDVRTLIGVLFWANLAVIVTSVAYRLTKPKRTRTVLLNYVDFAKLFQCIAFFLLFYRDSMPNILSVNLGNSFLLLGFYFECQALLSVAKQSNSVKQRIMTIILAAGLVLFNIAELLNGATNLRVAFASACVIALFVLPIANLLFGRHGDAYLRCIGALYTVFVLLLVPRIAFTLANANATLFTDVTVQSLTFISLVMINLCSIMSFYILSSEERQNMREQYVSTDYLTNLLNRQTFLIAANQVMHANAKEGNEVSLALLNVDNFKSIIAECGDSFGDEVLRFVADTLGQNARKRDLLSRYSGKQFAMVLPLSDKATALAVLERISKKISSHKFDTYPHIRLVVSVGVTTGAPSVREGTMPFLNTADRALFQAKTNVSDKIVFIGLNNF